MQKLAARTGIPRVTISRVLNGYPHVSARTRAKVRAAVERHGYEGNLLARSLVLRKSGLAAFIVPDIRPAFYGRMIDLVEREIRPLGMSLLSFNSFFDAERERHLLALVRRLQTDALIIAPITASGCLVSREALSRCRKPVVYFDRYVPERGTSVLLDNIAAGRLAAEYLISLGHRRLAVLESSEDALNVCVRDRSEGFRQAVRKHGFDFGREQVLRLDWPEPSAAFDYGYALAETGLARLRARRVTALFAHTDSIALGAMAALGKAGLRVPEDISVIGCDDLDFAAYTNPPLTTVCQPVEELAKQLADVLAGRAGPGCRQIMPGLAERGSCARFK